MVGADKIIGVDLNDGKEEWGRRFGMTHFVNPRSSAAISSSICDPDRRAAPTSPSIAPATPP